MLGFSLPEQKEIHLCYQRWNYMPALVNTNRCIFFLSYYIRQKILDNSIISKFNNPKMLFSWIFDIRLCWINSYVLMINNFPCSSKGQLSRSSHEHGHLSSIQFLIYVLLIFSTSQKNIDIAATTDIIFRILYFCRKVWYGILTSTISYEEYLNCIANDKIKKMFSI